VFSAAKRVIAGFLKEIRLNTSDPPITCNAAVTVPTGSTLSPPRLVPRPALLQTKLQKKKRYETTVILIDDCAAALDNRKKLTKWTDDFNDARNWLIRELDAFHGEGWTLCDSVCVAQIGERCSDTNLALDDHRQAFANKLR